MTSKKTTKKSKQTGVPTQLKRAGIFKGFLFVGAIVIAGVFFLFTGMLVNQIRDSARSNLNLSVKYYRSLLLSDNPELAYEAVQNIEFPIVLSDSLGNPKFWRNLDMDVESNSPEAYEIAREFILDVAKLGNEPVELEVLPGVIDYFHYGDPALIKLLRVMSMSSALTVSLYILIGYMGFRMIRKAEERSVWVGMARETAHQLGTPISSLMGWLEVLGEESGEAVKSMKEDVGRLEKIAIRFSKIGTQEKLHNNSLSEVATVSVNYMRGRVGKTIDIQHVENESAEIPMQPELLSWVIENLVRNGAQAMDGKGQIRVETGLLNDEAYIDISDQGKGIETRNQEAIFRPGYTTKRRGWGLGLSLGRRIIEEVHQGRIFVKESRPGEGTTIRMVLPK
jgi:two-component system, sporulation sensor kinase D